MGWWMLLRMQYGSSRSNLSEMPPAGNRPCLRRFVKPGRFAPLLPGIDCVDGARAPFPGPATTHETPPTRSAPGCHPWGLVDSVEVVTLSFSALQLEV